MSRGDGRGQSRQPCPHPRHGEPSPGRQRFRAVPSGRPPQLRTAGQGHGGRAHLCHLRPTPPLPAPAAPPASPANRAPSSSGGGSQPSAAVPPRLRFPSPLSPARAARRSGRLSPALQTAPADGKRDPPPAASFP